MKDLTAWIALYAALVATGSAAFQWANYLLTGGRVSVNVRTGTLVGDTIIAPRAGDFVAWGEGPRVYGQARPAIVVEATNVGRQAVTVQRWGLCGRNGAVLYPVTEEAGPPIPHRLEVGGEPAIWAIDLAEAIEMMKIMRETLGTSPTNQMLTQLTADGSGQAKIRGAVLLGDGRVKHSRQWLTWPPRR
ncbi:hypothetical protein AB0N38_10730 [Micromonospora aurantiaca]|uniref:hypothetical protein n=1 Tax=Micromonospora aurantiaca (nom. illeg.) TaxID=47850 RepID=UPI003413A3D3